ncbi:MAG: P-loop NTPase [Bacteroidales bacterium]|nr:P-loop NTPase [Bacteroidales bacterium]
MKRPFEIVFLSGKGGTGKTSITGAFASIAGNAVFADCDVDAADLHLILSPVIYHEELFSGGKKARIQPQKCSQCGNCIKLCRFGAIEKDKDLFIIDEYACEGCGLCLYACLSDAITIESNDSNRIYFSKTRFGEMVYGKIGIAEENSGKLVSKIRKYAKQTAAINKADFILVDGPPGIGCPVISSITGTNLVVAITEPTSSGWHDLQRLILMIRQFHTPIQVIINKYDLNPVMSTEIENNLKKMEIPVLGKIPYDEKIVHALIDGKAFPECPFLNEITNKLIIMWNNIKSKVYEPKSI